ncbi:MAG: hypothetical protein HOO08_08540 [Opitutae bacterium]|jgi:hypothetical protein|nr:hypothetical protein [Opitutae bacterium]
MVWLYIFVSLTVASVLGSCPALSKKPFAVPYHQLYQTIEDPEVLQFLNAGLQMLQRAHEPLEFSVNEILLLQSKKNERGHRYAIAEGFSLTEIVDAEAGIFAIYISVPPSHREFYPLLAHEIGHLKQPSLIDDWAMEGFCMLFSEDLCDQQGQDWSIWKRRLHADSDDPYARAYHRALRLK